MAKKETKFSKTKRFRDIRSECSSEISLPDFNPDVRKILNVSADAHPISVFAGAEGLECSGGVNFNVIYLDFDGEVHSTAFNGDYDFKVKCDTENYNDSFMESKISGVSLRLMSPRKIAAKATLENAVTVITDELLTIGGDALEEGRNPEMDTVTLSNGYTILSKMSEREYAESVSHFDGKTTDEVQVLHTAVTPASLRTELVDSEVDVSGKLNIVMLIKTDDVPVYKLEKSIDIAERISMADAKEGGDLRAMVDIASVSPTISGDETGVEIVLNVVTETRVLCIGNEDVELVCDSYLCDAECDNSYTDVSLSRYMPKVVHKAEINEKRSVSDMDIGKLREVVFADARAHINEVNYVENGLEISGEIQVSAIAGEMKDNDSVEYVPLKFPIKFNQYVNCNCQIAQNIKTYYDVNIDNVSVSVDSSNVYFKSDLEVCVDLVEEKIISALSESNVMNERNFDGNTARVTVYYPTTDDTLYSIAKAYHTTREKLILDNPSAREAISPDEKISSKVRHLIIT